MPRMSLAAEESFRVAEPKRRQWALGGRSLRALGLRAVAKEHCNFRSNTIIANAEGPRASKNFLTV